MVLRLVRRELHHQAWQVKQSLAPYGTRVFGTHERAIPGSEEELRIDKCTKQRVARGTIQAPQALRLC